MGGWALQAPQPVRTSAALVPGAGQAQGQHSSGLDRSPRARGEAVPRRRGGVGCCCAEELVHSGGRRSAPRRVTSPLGGTPFRPFRQTLALVLTSVVVCV